MNGTGKDNIPMELIPDVSNPNGEEEFPLATTEPINVYQEVIRLSTTMFVEDSKFIRTDIVTTPS